MTDVGQISGEHSLPRGRGVRKYPNVATTMARNLTQTRFADAVRKPDAEIDLAEAALAFASAEYPDLDIPHHLERIDGLALAARRTMPPGITDLERTRRVAAFLFEEMGFHGNRDEYYDARNSYLNEVLDRRLGLPITLSVLFIEVAQRAGIELHGVALPAHFLVKFQDGAEEVFFDPFHRGRELTEQGCIEQVAEVMGRPVRLGPAVFARCPRKGILRRMLNNLRVVHLNAKDLPRAVRTIEMLLILDPDSLHDLRDLGVLYHHAERDRESIVCFERYLELSPDARDAETIEQNLEILRRKVRGETV